MAAARRTSRSFVRGFACGRSTWTCGFATGPIGSHGGSLSPAPATVGTQTLDAVAIRIGLPQRVGRLGRQPGVIADGGAGQQGGRESLGEGLGCGRCWGLLPLRAVGQEQVTVKCHPG